MALVNDHAGPALPGAKWAQCWSTVGAEGFFFEVVPNAHVSSAGVNPFVISIQHRGRFLLS